MIATLPQSESLKQELREQGLRFGISVHCCALEPTRPFGLTMGNASALQIEIANTVLGFRVASLRGPCQQRQRFRKSLLLDKRDGASQCRCGRSFADQAI